MAILSELIFYPVKSCAGIAVSEAVLTEAGLQVDGVCDREWMVVDEEGQFLTQREHPRMALIVPHIANGTLELSAPGMATLTLAPSAATARVVTIWDDSVEAEDCGDASATWVSEAICAPCRLVHFPNTARRWTGTNWTGGVPAPTRFADGYPLLLIGAASLADINEKLRATGRQALPMNRFRPNLVVDGIGAFEEDYCESLRFGDAEIKPVKPCPRCPIPSIDQATGVPGPDPLDLLQSYRRKRQLDDAVCVGMNCIVSAGAGARLQVGQQVDVTLSF